MHTVLRSAWVGVKAITTIVTKVGWGEVETDIGTVVGVEPASGLLQYMERCLQSGCEVYIRQFKKNTFRFMVVNGNTIYHYEHDLEIKKSPIWELVPY